MDIDKADFQKSFVIALIVDICLVICKFDEVVMLIINVLSMYLEEKNNKASLANPHSTSQVMNFMIILHLF